MHHEYTALTAPRLINPTHPLRRFAIPAMWVAVALLAVAILAGIWMRVGPLLAFGQPLTINDLKHLRSGEAAQVSGVVTFADPQARVIFLQDATAGMRLEVDSQSSFPQAGDAVKISGTIASETKSDTQVGLNGVHLSQVRVVVKGRGTLPDPQQATLLEQFSSGGLKDATRVHTAGTVRAFRWSNKKLVIEIADSGLTMFATILNPRDADPSKLIDARISVKGTLQLGYRESAGLRPDGDTSPVPHLWTSDIRDLQVLEPPAPEIQLVPSIWALISDSNWTTRGRRVRVRGTVVKEHTRNANTVFIESGGVFMPVECESSPEVATGDVVEAVGWPNHTRFTTILQRANLQPIAREELQTPAPIRREKVMTDLTKVRALSKEDAARWIPVDFEGVISAVQAPYQFFFVQAGQEGIFVDAYDQSVHHLHTGQHVRIRGFTASGDYAPVLTHARVDVLGTVTMPAPQIVDPEEALTGTYDSEWVEIEGQIRPFEYQNPYYRFKLISAAGAINGTLLRADDAQKLRQFVDARVRVRGVFASIVTSEGVLVGYRILVDSPDYFTIVRPAPAAADSAVHPINQLLKFTSQSGNRRSRVQGVVTLRTPSQLYVQDASGSVVVQSSNTEVRRGDLIEAEGYAAPSDYGPVMNDAAVTVISHDNAVEPQPAEADQILSGTFDSRVVRIKAKVLSNIRSATQQTLALQNGYTSFNAQLDGSDGLLNLDEGTVVEVTGVCSVQRHLLSRDNSALPISFRILLRSPEDVRVVQEASWWNIRHAWTVLAGLVLVICVAFLWVIALRRRVNNQTSALEQQRSFLRAVLDMCPNFIFVKDRDGRFSLVNRAFAQAWGRQPEDMVGKDDIEVGIDREQAAAYRRDDAEIIESGREKVVVEPHTDLHGHQLWMHTVKRPLLDESGQPTQVVGVANDITLHKHAEETLQKAREAAETANRAKSEFLANMSHEIRTPLNGIIGMTALWMETEMTREQREYLETVRVSADGLLTVINDVLDFSKIEAGRFEIDSAEFNLREILDSAVKTLALRAHEKNLELVCDVAPDVPECLRGDASRLRQVVLNLAGNAIKFTAQGEVVIRVSLQAQDSLSTTLHFSVRDTGIGIDSARHKAIFDPFVQADSSTTRIYGGTGLGLTISSRLVTMMGGKIWLDSEVGKGSEFHFTVRMQCVHHAGAADPAAVLADARMLVVEDNDSARSGLDSLLRRWKVRTVLAANAEAAMAALSAAELEGDPIQVSLIDVQMPAHEGYALIEKMRARPDLSQQIVALLSAMEQREQEARCKNVGVQSCLVKPIRAVDLRAALASIVHDVQAATATLRPKASSPPPPPSAGLNILLAEDNLVNQMLMVRLLQKRGHRVTVAGNGKIALEQLEREHFDLVLMDVQMPELDGLAAAQEIRRREQLGGRHIPIVALTAHAMSGDRERCLAAGMEGYLTKPINTKELDETLKLYGKSALANAAAG